MWSKNSKDKAFKLAFSRSIGISSKNQAIADFEFILNDWYVCIEYENSSRGLLHNLVKLDLFQTQTNKKVIAVMIQTEFHSKNHYLDKMRAEHIASKIKRDNFRILFVEEDKLSSFGELMDSLKDITHEKQDV